MPRPTPDSIFDREPVEPLVCPLCGSANIEAKIVDLRPMTVEDLLAEPPHPLTYGLVATCRICELAWKPSCG